MNCPKKSWEKLGKMLQKKVRKIINAWGFKTCWWKLEGKRKLNMFYREILDVLAIVHEIRSTKRRQKKLFLCSYNCKNGNIVAQRVVLQELYRPLCHYYSTTYFLKSNTNYFIHLKVYEFMKQILKDLMYMSDHCVSSV